MCLKIGDIIFKDNDECSHKIRGQSYSDLFSEIDTILEDFGYCLEAFDDLYAEHFEGKGCFSIYIFPVFVELLKRGYKIYPDLIR